MNFAEKKLEKICRGILGRKADSNVTSKGKQHVQNTTHLLCGRNNIHKKKRNWKSENSSAQEMI